MDEEELDLVPEEFGDLLGGTTYIDPPALEENELPSLMRGAARLGGAKKPSEAELEQDPYGDPGFVEALRDGLRRRALLRHKRSMQYQDAIEGKPGQDGGY